MRKATLAPKVRLNYARIREIDRQIRARFTYTGDGKKDAWLSYADRVLEGLPWAGDCDDLTATILDMVTREGHPPGDCYYLMVDSTGGTKIDHMVGLILSPEGEQYVVGDTFGPIYSVRKMRHNPLRISPWTELNWYTPKWDKNVLVPDHRVV